MIDDNIFNQWNEVKKVLNKKGRNHYFKEGQIWWCSIGQNIGKVVLGQIDNEDFTRIKERLGLLLGFKNIHPSLRRESVGKSQK